MKKLILLISIILPIFALSGCIFSQKVKLRKEVIELEGFDVQPGKHCESSAMMNALHYQGASLSENLINGLSSSMAFFYSNEGMPFIGGRVYDLKEFFQDASGINIISVKPKNKQDAYNSVKQKLKEGIPVVLQVNLRYLPYNFEGKYGNKYTSFGLHFITIYKLDEQNGTALVTDTDSIKGQQIKISDLMKARNENSSIGNPEYKFYYFEFPKSWKMDYQTGLEKSIKNLIEHYRQNDGSLTGLQALSDMILDIENIIPNKFMIEPTYYNLYGFIEEFGTGGSAFRNFYRDYLIETAEAMQSNNIKSASILVDESSKKWKDLALKFKEASSTANDGKSGTEKRKIILQEASNIAIEIYEIEKKMIEQLEKLYNIIKDKK